jgi:cell surface protein SprA
MPHHSEETNVETIAGNKANLTNNYMRFFVYSFPLCLALTLCLALISTLVSGSGGHHVPDPFEALVQDTIPPLTDRHGNFVDDPQTNPIDLSDPALVKRDVEYDPVSGLYIITERIGGEYFRMPTYMTFEEYMEWSAAQERERYWKLLAGVSSRDRSDGGKVDPVSVVDISKDLIDRLFGGTEVDIRPQGNVDLTFGVDFYRQDNPTLLERQRRRGGFDFDMEIQVNVDGKIGEKLSTSFNYNTKSTFDFENKLKLDYDSQKFSDDAIIQKIEAGDVSLPLRGTLIQGSQSLFGIKTELQFGHLRLTAIASQQRSEQNDLVIQGGSVVQEFEVPIDQYVENRHFFLSHFNRETFEPALANLPQINSLFKITRMEVWVTNDKNQTTDVRDVVAIADLGESRRITPGNEHFVSSADTSNIEFRDICMTSVLPANEVNTILRDLEMIPNNRFIENVNSSMASLGLKSTRDYEKIRARRLSPSEYTVHPDLGFISLNTRLQSDHVVASPPGRHGDHRAVRGVGFAVLGSHPLRHGRPAGDDVQLRIGLDQRANHRRVRRRHGPVFAKEPRRKSRRLRGGGS